MKETHFGPKPFKDTGSLFGYQPRITAFPQGPVQNQDTRRMLAALFWEKPVCIQRWQTRLDQVWRMRQLFHCSLLQAGLSMLNVTGRCGLTDYGRIGKDMPAVGSRLPKPALEYAGDACKTKDNGSGDKRTIKATQPVSDHAGTDRSQCLTNGKAGGIERNRT